MHGKDEKWVQNYDLKALDHFGDLGVVMKIILKLV
jgi:hypothetical protein